MHDVSSNSTVERRRSPRVSESVPLVVRGIDLLGHPFEERTATVTLNLQGCRYFSKYHLPRNSWISLEVANGGERRNVRARVAWIHRPHSIREVFHIAVELEGPANIWGLQSAPGSWTTLLSANDSFNSAPAGASGENFETPNFPIAEFSTAYTRTAHVPAAEAAVASTPMPHTPMEGPVLSMTSYSSDPGNNFDQPYADVPAQAEVSASTSGDDNSAAWRERLTAEMAVAQRQWDELLQSSIDRTLQRVSAQLPERAQEAVRSTEEKMAQQFANLSQMLAHMSAEAQSALAGVKASIEQEIWRARDVIENTRQQMLDRIGADTEARVAPHVARVPELLRELSGREEQVTESLSLHRERLRQASDNTLRDVASQIEASTANVHLDFEAARVNALAKWNEELESLSARAGHAAGESISRTAEWLQQETRERLQVLAEQTLATTTAAFQEETTKAAGLFATHLEGQSIFHLAQVHQQLDGVANDLTGRTRNQLSEAAEAAAASFGQVIHNISAEQVEQFAQTSQYTVDQKRMELENYTRQLHAAFENDSAVALQNAREQASSHLQYAVSEARTTLAAESAAALDAHRNEREAHAQQWSQNINRMADDAAAQCNGRIQTAADAWTVASVRRLNEHGQNVIESLIRSADQALRDSASKIFEGLAVALREHGANAAGASAGANFPSGTSHQEQAPYQDEATYQQDGQSNQMPPPQDNQSWQPGA